MASLQMRPTRTLLHQLAAYGLIPEGQAVRRWTTTYVFLRNLEHRLQYLDDAQTQTLPHAVEDRRRLAESMGFSRLGRFRGPSQPACARRSPAISSRSSAPPRKTSPAIPWPACTRFPTKALERLDRTRLQRQSQAALTCCGDFLGQPLRRPARRQQGHARRPAAAADRGGCGLCQSPRMPPWRASSPCWKAISRRGPYLRLLREEYPQTLRQVAKLVSSSPWAAQYLTRQPHLLDEMLDVRQLMAPPTGSCRAGTARSA
jgi:glutamate-ammonia-ligase adenylyltransferase